MTTMNGPFEVNRHNADVVDSAGVAVARGEGVDEQEERENAEMVCAALNAAYYFAKATGARDD